MISLPNYKAGKEIRNNDNQNKTDYMLFITITIYNVWICFTTKIL